MESRKPVSTLPTLFGNPSGFPHSRDLDDWIYVFSCPRHSNHRHRKGLITDVLGPQRKACPNTLTRAESEPPKDGTRIAISRTLTAAGLAGEA